MVSALRSWLRLPSRMALLFGMGAVSVSAAGAAPVDSGDQLRDAVRVPLQGAKSFGDLRIWTEGERVFVAEGDRPAEELRLSNSAEAALLRQMLQEKGATAAVPHRLQDRIILVGSGGMGTHWEAQRPADADKLTTPETRGSRKTLGDTGKPGQQNGKTTRPSVSQNAPGN